ncbi:MAG: hypothetical protein MUF37_05885 [Methanoregulaceae archaeon]|jgi:hypothetical protein|nr:hypothetical protein [Methanoregulaceae archaeon]
MEPPVNPDNKIILIVLLFAGILLVGLFVYAGIIFLSNPGMEKSNTPESMTLANPVTTGPRDFATTKSTTAATLSLTSPPVPPTTAPLTPVFTQNPTSFPAISDQPAVTGIPVTPTYGDSSGVVAPQPFTLSVSPASASGKPGETISYTLRIGGGEGQTEPVHFTLTASALFFSQTYELGDEQPPFPKTSVYQFTIPTNIPSGITINGVLTATGAGQTREQAVTLNVL